MCTFATSSMWTVPPASGSGEGRPSNWVMTTRLEPSVMSAGLVMSSLRPMTKEGMMLMMSKRGFSRSTKARDAFSAALLLAA